MAVLAWRNRTAEHRGTDLGPGAMPLSLELCLSARLGENQGHAEAQQKSLQFCAKHAATRTKGALIQ